MRCHSTKQQSRWTPDFSHFNSEALLIILNEWFSYSRMTCNQNNTYVELILNLLARLCYYYWFTILFQFTILLSLGQLTQLGQGGWVSCCECARLKNWFSTWSTWFWPLAWSQTSALISAEEKNAFLFFHSFHSFNQRKATIFSESQMHMNHMLQEQYFI